MQDKELTSGEIVMPCESLDPTMRFFVDELNFRIVMIYPADAPRIAVVAGYGTRIRLDAGAEGSPPRVILRGRNVGGNEERLTAPNGAEIVILPEEDPLDLPPLKPELIVSVMSESTAFGEGRAGMQYRDLMPGRYGGRFIASHIRIQAGGPVPDYVHHHHVQFQFIFCVNGWVKVLYEDQGEPMLLKAGDCFLQPPHIRHRVLECSDQMEVVEVGCPAEHETCVDHEMTLPTGKVKPRRVFGGQRFVFHQAEKEPWRSWDVAGMEWQHTDIQEATQGIVSVHALRATAKVDKFSLQHNHALRLLFIMSGQAHFSADGDGQWDLQRGDSCANSGRYQLHTERHCDRHPPARSGCSRYRLITTASGPNR